MFEINLFFKNTSNITLYKIENNILFDVTKQKNNNFFKKQIIWNVIKKYYCFFLLLYWFKIYFRGKSYRVRKFKTNNKFTFYFGYSHWTRLIYKSTHFFIRRVKRHSFPGFTHYYELFKTLYSKIKKIKTTNKYTKRGLRMRKQSIVRRFGKISHMISILHQMY